MPLAHCAWIEYPTTRTTSNACHSSLVYATIMRLFKLPRSLRCCKAKRDKP
ncbi:hypothetical protein DO71_5754 [Burkholderia pseudomallei]|nr:hypothetical protein DO71_5754 [Burkholderia pseudomallei]